MSQTLPSTMRVVEIAAFGPPERLAVGHRAVPVPTPGSVLVKVAGAGVNRADVMQRRGQYPPPKGASDLLGLEVSGTVAAVGDDVSTWTVGDRVCGLVAGGGYAEYCVVPVPQCLPIPDSVTLADAAALPEAAMTVWTNVFDRGRLRPGERLLVHGGSSGIGTTAIQLARLWGAEVFATAGTAEKCAACESLGATRAINYRETEFAEAIRTATDGRGVDVILDMVGGPYLSSNLESLAPEGRLVVIGLMGGTVAEVDLATLMSRRLVLTGSTLRSRSISLRRARSSTPSVRRSGRGLPTHASARSSTSGIRWTTQLRPTARWRRATTSGNSCSCPSVASVPTRYVEGRRSGLFVVSRAMSSSGCSAASIISK